MEAFDRQLAVEHGHDDVAVPRLELAVNEELVAVADPRPSIESPTTRTMNVAAGSMTSCSVTSIGPSQ